MTSPIFISGRFRSGSSFLWNVFQHLKGHRAWYEPLNPQLLAHVKYTTPKADHVHVDDYWASYRDHPDFVKHYKPEFAHNRLWLEAGDEYPELKQYIQALLDLSGHERPVLQFNRVDLRLGWLKANFPDATIVSVRRNPWWLYRSQRKHIEPDHRDDPDHMDAYELAQWSWALSSAFPCLIGELNSHAFERCYALLQMGNVVADRCADVVLDLERDVFDSDDYLQRLLAAGVIAEADVPVIENLKISKQQADFNAADKALMSELMSRVDLILSQQGVLKALAQATGAGGAESSVGEQVLQAWLGLMNQQQSEQTRLLHLVRRLEHENESLKQQINEQAETD